MFTFILGTGAYKADKYEEDADKVVSYYRDRGYIEARVGQPELKILEDSKDAKTRWVELRVPVTEGRQYRVGKLEFDGNKIVEARALRPLFKVEEGDIYSEKKIRKGFEKAKEVYGTGGYMEFTGYPDLAPRDGNANGGSPSSSAGPSAPAAPAGPAAIKGAPIVDVTLRLQEGKQYFVNRITFVGNTNTRDNVIRREIRLYENNRFDTVALQNSIRRINQLGYFKPLQGPGKDVMVDKTAGVDNKLDVTLKVEEQNRNQLTFGAGVSQFEGFFGQLSFQTANFLGRGESLTVSLQAGSRAQNFTVGFTEPFLFDRNMTAGVQVFKQQYRYISQFTQDTTGGALTLGYPLGRGFTRMFTNYSYQRVRVTELAQAYQDAALLRRNPFLYDSLLIGQNGQRIISKITPSIIHNTVDQPIFPTSGKRLSASIDLAGLGGNTQFYKPQMEGIYIWKQNNKFSMAMRGQVEFINPIGRTLELPIFEKLFLGGEYSVRGYDIRSIGPRDVGTPQAPGTFVVIGGDKSLLFNAEYLITIAGPVRLVLFYDAGQVRDEGQHFSWEEWKTSTGAEIRFFMPVLNVPFRLIFAANPQRDGVLNNDLTPAKSFVFKFAVGSTF